MLTRRSLLAGASALTVSLVMPAIESAPALDIEALVILTRHVRNGFLSWSHTDQANLAQQALGHRRTREIAKELTHKGYAITAVDRMLRVGFRAMLREQAQHGADGLPVAPLYRGGALTPLGQLIVTYLPIAPSDYHPDIFPALNRLAPHYLA